MLYINILRLQSCLLMDDILTHVHLTHLLNILMLRKWQRIDRIDFVSIQFFCLFIFLIYSG